MAIYPKSYLSSACGSPVHRTLLSILYDGNSLSMQVLKPYQRCVALDCKFKPIQVDLRTKE